MDFASILDGLNIWVVLAEILKSLPEITPHLGPVNSAAGLLITSLSNLSSRVGLGPLVLELSASCGCPRELIFFLKEIVWTNGSLSLLRGRSAIILCILNISSPLLVRRKLLVWDFNWMLIDASRLLLSVWVDMSSVMIVVFIFVLFVYPVPIFDISSIIFIVSQQHYLLRQRSHPAIYISS